MLELDVVLLARLLVLRERRPATRAPLRRAMSLVQPAAPLHLFQEAPDELDVRVAERVVRVVPVHPHAEALGLFGNHAREVRHALLAARRELGEPVLLDVTLRVEAERLLDLDLDVEPLAVEAVLVTLVEAAESLVALEDILDRPPPGVMDAHRVVRGDRPVHEAEPRPAPVACDQLEERAFTLPELEDLVLERGMIRDRRKRRERIRHAFDSREREQRFRTGRFSNRNPKKGTLTEWQPTSPRPRSRTK